MLMTVMGRNSSASYYGELAGVRALITGLSPACGVDVARKFADHRARLVVHATAASPELDAVTTMLAETASEVKLFTDACRDSKSSISFAKAAAQAFGGLDVVINLIPISAADMQGRASIDDDRGSRRREADAAAARHAHRRQPHAADAQRRPRFERHDHAGAAQRRRSRHCRHRPLGARRRHPRRSPALGAAGHSRQRRRPVRHDAGSRRRASPASRTSRRSRSTSPRGPAGRSPARCSTPPASPSAAAERSAS